MRKVILLSAFVGALAGSIAMATPVLQMVPPTAGQTNSEVRAITPDGRWVAGDSGTDGFLWDTVTAPAQSLRAVCGGYMKNARGVAYRGDADAIAVLGLQDYASGNNTVTLGTYHPSTGIWDKTWRDGTNYKNSVLGVGNALAQQTDDVVFASFAKGGAYYISVAKFTAGVPAVDSKSTPSGSELTVHGVSAAGLAVGSRMNTGVMNSYSNLWVGNGTGSAAYIPGLTATLSNEAFCVAGDRTTGKVFGRTYKEEGIANTYYPYMYDYSTSTLSYLPMFGDEQGSTGLGYPYGCTADGRYVVGMLYRGSEKAVLWDTQLNTVTDLTEFASQNGILGGFTVLSRGYSVGVNALGQPVVAGKGTYNEGGTFYSRGFVLTIPEPATLGLLVLGLPLMLWRRR